MRVLSENQQLLARYLSAAGCSFIASLKIGLDVWEPEETIEMLQFCKDNHGRATERDFVAAAEEISDKKRRRTIEDVWNIQDPYRFLNGMDLYLSIKCGDGDRLERLNDDEKTIFILSLFKEYILYGSFTEFLFNYCGDFANDIVPALERVGAMDMSEICKEVFSIYGDTVPLDRDVREDVFNARGEAAWTFADRCNKKLSESNDLILNLCYQFILKNKDSFC